MTAREEQLAVQGWQKKTTTNEPRLSELVQAYRRIGCDVHVEPFDSSEQLDCQDCMKTATGTYKTIYIRKTGKDQT